MAASATEKMNIVIVGHVDHGKSTVVGRLLADTGSLPRGKLEQVREECRQNAKPFEYAFLLDALKDEKQQGITIDTARAFFKSAQRGYILIDAPGHIEFLKNMVSGAARAEAALLVIDAQEGIQENSRRHGYLLSMLGIRQVAVCVNKMDLVGYRRESFESIEASYREFLQEIGLKSSAFLPVAAREGENLIRSSEKMPWFKGPSVLEMLDRFEKTPSVDKKPLRLPVQGVYKFTEEGDTRRIVAGRVESGTLSVGDEVVFLPSHKRSVVKTIEEFHGTHVPARTSVSAGLSTGITLTEQVYVQRGEILCKAGQPLPKISTLLRVELFWMGKRPMVLDRPYKLKLAAAQSMVRLKKLERVIDAADLKKIAKKEIARHDVARCVLESAVPLAVDLAEQIETTGRFVLVDEYDIAGGGIILEAMDPLRSGGRSPAAGPGEDVSVIGPEERSSQYEHRPALVLLTGKIGLDKKTIAKELEKQLFARGAKTYLLGMGDRLRGLDAAVEQHRLERHEHVRRMGEAAHLFMDAGLIVVATASNLDEAEWQELRRMASREGVFVVTVGPGVLPPERVDLSLDPARKPADNAAQVLAFLQEKKIL